MTLRLIALVVVAAGVFPAAGQQVQPTPAVDDETGFEAIFNGTTLDGWEGDPTYWRVENGCLVGEITPETLLKRNSFIIWRGGTTGDFELKVEYRNFRLKKMVPKAGPRLRVVPPPGAENR